jgi:hypothetical protein
MRRRACIYLPQAPARDPDNGRLAEYAPGSFMALWFGSIEGRLQIPHDPRARQRRVRSFPVTLSFYE